MRWTIRELERAEDARGWVAEAYNGDPRLTLRNIHLGTMTPRAVRGNHVHHQSHEWIVFFGGPIELRLREEDTRIARTLERPSRVDLPPGVAHGFRNAGGEEVAFVAYRDRPHDPQNPDAEPVELFER